MHSELYIHYTFTVCFGYCFTLDSYPYMNNSNVKQNKRKFVPTLLSPLSMLQSELVHCVLNVDNEKGFYFLLKYIYCVYYITLVTLYNNISDCSFKNSCGTFRFLFWCQKNEKKEQRKDILPKYCGCFSRVVLSTHQTLYIVQHKLSDMERPATVLKASVGSPGTTEYVSAITIV